MSQAPQGTHLCEAHQGNHSLYAQKNCELCQAREESKRAIEQRDKLLRDMLRAVRLLQPTRNPDAHVALQILMGSLATAEHSPDPGAAASTTNQEKQA